MKRLLVMLVGLAVLTAACTSNAAGTGAGSPSKPTSAGLTVPATISLPPTIVAPTTAPSTTPAPITSTAPTTSASSSHSGSATARAVARPVTAGGDAAAGWTVREQSLPIMCSPSDSSPVAVDPGISFCSPSAAYAIACWQSDVAHALCAFDVAKRIVARYPLDGQFTTTPAPTRPVPFSMTLADGSVCKIRDGGTGLNLTDHPDWIVYYYCDGQTAVYGPRNGTGVDTTADVWTVRLASRDSEGGVATVPVRSASFLGTATD